MKKKLFVLFIEDSQDDADLTIRLLKTAGYEVVCQRVETAKEMTEAMNREPWDLVLSDYSMPQFTVQEALEIFHAHGADIPFIVISGAIGEEKAVQLIKAGVHDYLLKDHMTRFISVVDRELHEANTRRELVKVSTELEISEKKFKSYIEHAPDGVFVIDSKGQNIEVNEAACHITGYTRDQLLETSVLSLISGESGENAVELGKKLLETGSLNANFEVRNKNGANQWLAVNLIQISEDHFIGFINDITVRENAIIEVMKAREELQHLNEYMTDARENERATIAMEIHDELGQVLTAIKIDMNWVHEHIADSIGAADKIRKIIGMVNETIKKVQRISAELRPGLLDDLGLAPAMQWYSDEFEQRTGIKCNLTVEDLPDSDQRFNLALYRIFQEAMTNIIRHAHAQNVRVSLTHKPEGITMIIEDDGVGIPPEKISDGKSLGLLGMRERARQINGTVDFINHVGSGTKILTFIPLQTTEPDIK